LKILKEFIVGSKVFFAQKPDYMVHDSDKICIVDRFPSVYKHSCMHMQLDGDDVFMYEQNDKEWFINDILDSATPMKAGKFLIKEFADYLNFTVKDLKRLENVFNIIDPKHKYEKIIYDAYIKNDGYFLTDEQLNNAYEIYKKERNS